MSHFPVMVVRDPFVTLEEQLLPFCEFECMGENSQYVQDIDQTDEARDEYADEDKNEYPTFSEFIEGYYGYKALAEGEDPNIEGAHKFGYFVVNAQGEVVRVVRRTNPNRKWDWYQVGGRWANFFQLKNGRRVNIARKEDIDFESVRQKAGDAAAKHYDEAHAVIAGREIPHWNSVRQACASAEDARTAYNAHPVLQDLREQKLLEAFDDVDELDCSREVYIARARNSAVATFAVLKDGTWYERGHMMMFACVADEKDEAAWTAQVAQLLDDLPGEAELVLVDCHI